jgi:hypothetical protein
MLPIWGQDHAPDLGTTMLPIWGQDHAPDSGTRPCSRFGGNNSITYL